jgi:O-succinylbenzoic acid--CoA ligase
MDTKSQRDIRRVSPSCAIPELAGEITQALVGKGPALGIGEIHSDSCPNNISLIIGTSGTAGLSKEVSFSSAALLASARASNKFLNALAGAQWSLLLPMTHVAAVNVVIRSMESGTLPIDLRDYEDEYPKVDFTSIVPTQLFRALNGDDRLLRHLQSAKKVLVGGAALNVSLAQLAQNSGIDCVETYGMTETSGGCVYNGQAIEGVEFSLNDMGLVQIRGAVMASGYLNMPNLFQLHDGWFVTNDLGEISDRKLRILGRADDVIISGGENVSLTSIEATLSIRYPEIEFAAFAINDKQWGQALHLAVVGEISDNEILQFLEAALGVASKPKGILQLNSLPLLGIGKVDRLALAKMVKHE